jgi:hypothetical protein
MRRLIGVALAVAAIAAGCGDSGGDSAGAGDQASTAEAKVERTTDAMTKAQFVAHFNEVCRRAWPEIRRNAAEYSRLQDPHLSQKELFAKVVRYSFMAGFDFNIFNPMHELGTPSDRSEHQGTTMNFEMKEAVERAIHRMWLHSPAQLATLFADYNRAARRYGLDECLIAGSHLPHV